MFRPVGGCCWAVESDCCRSMFGSDSAHRQQQDGPRPPGGSEQSSGSGNRLWPGTTQCFVNTSLTNGTPARGSESWRDGLREASSSCVRDQPQLSDGRVCAAGPRSFLIALCLQTRRLQSYLCCAAEENPHVLFCLRSFRGLESPGDILWICEPAG